MKRVFAKRKKGLLASRFDSNGEAIDWMPIVYNEIDINKKYKIIKRKRNGVHRLERIL